MMVFKSTEELIMALSESTSHNKRKLYKVRDDLWKLHCSQKSAKGPYGALLKMYDTMSENLDDPFTLLDNLMSGYNRLKKENARLKVKIYDFEHKEEKE